MTTMLDRPNVVLVVLDTARAKDAVPADPAVTPTLASLAAEGAEYRQAFTSAPWTLPAHAGLFTGAFSSKHGAHGGHTYLDEGSPTLAEAFRDDGYETVGVSNNTWITAEFGFDRGFETFRKGWQYLQSGTDVGRVVREKDPRRKARVALETIARGNPLTTAANVLYTEVLDPSGDDGAARTTDWIDGWLDSRDDDRPFFLFANYLEPHVTYAPPREHAEAHLPAGATYDEARAIRQAPRAYDVGEYDPTDHEFELLRALYRGELSYVDEHVGRLVDAFEAAGEWENTLLVVVGDHGENVGEHGFFGHQYNVYDTLLHVPLVIHGPGFDGMGTIGGPVQLPDIAPTLLDAAGVEAKRHRRAFQGESFHPYADGPDRDLVIAEYLSPQPTPEALEDRFGSIPDEVWSYDRSLRTIRTDGYKLIRGSDGTCELYNVDADPGETIDLADERPDLAHELDARLDDWLDSFEHADRSGEVQMTTSTEQQLADLGYM